MQVSYRSSFQASPQFGMKLPTGTAKRWLRHLAIPAMVSIAGVTAFQAGGGFSGPENSLFVDHNTRSFAADTADSFHNLNTSVAYYRAELEKEVIGHPERRADIDQKYRSELNTAFSDFRGQVVHELAEYGFLSADFVHNQLTAANHNEKATELAASFFEFYDPTIQDILTGLGLWADQAFENPSDAQQFKTDVGKAYAIMQNNRDSGSTLGFITALFGMVMASGGLGYMANTKPPARRREEEAEGKTPPTAW